MTYNPNAPLDEIVFKPEDVSQMLTPVSEDGLISWRESVLKYIFSEMRANADWLVNDVVEIDLDDYDAYIDDNGVRHSVGKIKEWNIIIDFLAVWGWHSKFSPSFRILRVWNPNKVSD